ncbi:MAG TPA: CapA family protein [Aggregatilineales bacterium]|nr:CapA family protein [Anaerolineales bacterium]HRE48893.1 CapA family protein [Aggregatilineales bacterium]
MIGLIVALLSLTGCFARAGARVATPTLAPPTTEGIAPFATPIPAFPPTPLSELVPTAIIPPTDVPTAIAFTGTIRTYIALNVPAELQTPLTMLLQQGRLSSATGAEVQVQLTSLRGGQSSPLMALWVYVPVVRFDTVAGNIGFNDILRYWRGDLSAVSYLTNGQTPVFVTTATIYYWLTITYGAPPQNFPVRVVAPDQLATTIWGTPNAWGMIPYDKLDKTLKALTVDGLNILDSTLDMNQWQLKETFGLLGDAALVNEAAALINSTGRWLPTNRDLSRLTTLIVTGVTALTRATAYQMEINGVAYPARDIAPFLAGADILHTSNEVAFATDCPYPDPNSASLTFCSRDKYFDLLKGIRLGVVELTGNHVNDWGTAALSHSLDLYDANNMPYFGGGRNTDDARKALLITHNGNNLAFLGCNPVGPPGAWAAEKRPGAAVCDDAFLAVEIPRLRDSGYLVVMTIQYQELYEYSVPAVQKAFFQKYAQMGASVILGSQAHHPQGFGFAYGAFIHYGIGNLFFDQMFSLGTRQMFADKLIIYNGRHISTELFTGLIEDYARPRPMTEKERAGFLSAVFSAVPLQP